MTIDRKRFMMLALSMSMGACGPKPAPATMPDNTATTDDSGTQPARECVDWDPSGECTQWANGGAAPTSECVDWNPSGECIDWVQPTNECVNWDPSGECTQWQ